MAAVSCDEVSVSGAPIRMVRSGMMTGWPRDRKRRGRSRAAFALIAVALVACGSQAKNAAETGEEAVPEAVPADEVLAASTGPPVELGVEPVTVTVPLSEAARSRLRAAEGGKLRLALEGVTMLRPGVTYQVYIDLPPGVVPDASTPHFLGHLALFAEPGQVEMTRTFDLAGKVEALRRDKTWDDEEVRVTLVPAASREELAKAPGSGPFFRLRRIAISGR